MHVTHARSPKKSMMMASGIATNAIMTCALNVPNDLIREPLTILFYLIICIYIIDYPHHASGNFSFARTSP